MSSFSEIYGNAFAEYLEHPGEGNLHLAYELGREAVRQRLSVLDLALAHHDALAAAIEACAVDGTATQVVQAGSEFFVEALAAFEMVQRGFREARDAAALERRHAEMLRQLSTFLADASLAAGGPDSLTEVARLVAEQARELIAVQCCLVVVSYAGEAR